MKRPHPERVPEYLQHIIDAIDRATSYVAGMNRAAFEADVRTQDAVMRSIEIIGEAAQRVRSADPGFATRHAQVPWDQMYGMRNRIVHDYFAVDLDVVWQTLQRDLATPRRRRRFGRSRRRDRNVACNLRHARTGRLAEPSTPASCAPDTACGLEYGTPSPSP